MVANCDIWRRRRSCKKHFAATKTDDLPPQTGLYNSYGFFRIVTFKFIILRPQQALLPTCHQTSADKKRRIPYYIRLRRYIAGYTAANC